MNPADEDVVVSAAGAHTGAQGAQAAPVAVQVPAAVAQLRIRGLVQGVGLRPAVWRLARECGLGGEVLNDGAGVLIRAHGPRPALERFIARIEREAPPLARIDAMEVHIAPAAESESVGEARNAASALQGGFRIARSRAGAIATGIVPDAASCAACVAETADPFSRRHGYAFTNCTHCGPRFSIVRTIPYDRANTSMTAFALCAACRAEYADPADRRFHAQPIACPACGPQVRLEASAALAAVDTQQRAPMLGAWSTQAERCADDHAAGEHDDWPQRVAAWIAGGAIVAIKGLGGYHLACDATNAAAVARLRRSKRRDRKPFALMARDLAAIERYCFVSDAERALLAAAAAPIVLLLRRDQALPAELAPGLDLLGFMLPYTPLHHLLLRALDRPIVLTSGNVSDAPQCTDDGQARRQLADIADAWVMHDRAIVHRLDDSVARVIDGVPRLLRRARGYAPAPLALPAGFEHAAPVFATGGMLKNTFCLLKDGQAVLSQHHGDLDHPGVCTDYRRNIALYRTLFDHAPAIVAVDQHPDYLSTKAGIEWAERDGLTLEAVQHHHAHVASCLADNGVERTAGPVLGIALDGLGMGQGGALWGGELLLADYRTYRRIGCLKPVALLGGERAVREPWRNTYAHLAAALGWNACRARYAALDIVRFLERQPTATLDAMLAAEFQAPRASSCGRLFDAVAAAIGVCRARVAYEGEAAMALEAAARACAPCAAEPYPFAVSEAAGLVQIDPAPMWRALLDDLARDTAPAALAARFHVGLAQAICTVAGQCARRHAIDTIALTGGVFQNQVLFEAVSRRLRARRFTVLTHTRVPAGDGGLALGQALAAAARAME